MALMCAVISLVDVSGGQLPFSLLPRFVLAHCSSAGIFLPHWKKSHSSSEIPLPWGVLSGCFHLGRQQISRDQSPLSSWVEVVFYSNIELW